MSRWIPIAAVLWASILLPPPVCGDGAVDRWAAGVAVRSETTAAARDRCALVAARRKRVQVICHRGALEFAHENTLEAFRATLELGADGNEIDIRATKDGVLVCFHDDMLDHLLHAYGDVGDYNWEDLRRFRFRNPGRFGSHCRIPTLAEVFELHRRHAGLLHLDIKRAGLDRAIAALLDRMDLWDHVVAVNTTNGGVILQDRRFRAGRFKASLYLDRSDVDPAAIQAGLKKPGDMVMVEDPRGVLHALGRGWKRPSSEPVAPQSGLKRKPASNPFATATSKQLLAALNDADDWNHPAREPSRQKLRAERILKRAQAADAAGRLRTPSPELFAALEQRVRNRSLHHDWRHHGLDGAAALRALFRLKSPRAVELARFSLWRDDAALAKVANPKWKTPRAWTDFRLKMIVFTELRRHRPRGTAKLCRDYLALPEDQARTLSPLQYDAAADTLLAVSHTQNTAVELLRHKRREVRGRAVLVCLQHLDQKWASAALQAAAPFAVDYRLVGPKSRTPR